MIKSVNGLVGLKTRAASEEALTSVDPCCHGDSGTVTPIIYLPFCRAAFCRSASVISPDTWACDSVLRMRMRGEHSQRVFKRIHGKWFILRFCGPQTLISIESHVNKHTLFFISHCTTDKSHVTLILGPEY